MSEELLNLDLDVDGHVHRRGANDETTKEDEVEGHATRLGANDETDDGEVEGHVHRAG